MKLTIYHRNSTITTIIDDGISRSKMESTINDGLINEGTLIIKTERERKTIIIPYEDLKAATFIINDT